MKSPPLYCEFTRASLKTLAGSNHAEFPLERAVDGRLTSVCRDKLVSALRQFLRTSAVPAQSEAWCAIDARGVSLRCLLLPGVTGPGLAQLVRMQIETEFPLPPDELAWGFQARGEPQRQKDGTLKQAVLVAAVKMDAVAQYAEVLTAAGATPVFTLSSLARSALCPGGPGSFGVLEIGGDQSELIWFEGEARAFVRLLPPARGSDPDTLEVLSRAIDLHCRGQKLYICGNEDGAPQIIRRLPVGMSGEYLRIAPGAGSAAIQGLRKLAEGQGTVPLKLQLAAAALQKKPSQPALVEWGVRAAFLLLAVLLFPALEALVFTAPLSKTVGAFELGATNLEATVDHDLSFLQTLKQSQPPYLESVYIISKVAPSGIHIESLSFNRRGEMSLRGSLRNGDQVADFRSQLIASGYFASITVEEQTPTPDHQKVNIRMTGQWKPLTQLKAVLVGPAAKELGTNGPDAPVPGHGPKPPAGIATMPGPLNGGAN